MEGVLDAALAWSTSHVTGSEKCRAVSKFEMRVALNVGAALSIVAAILPAATGRPVSVETSVGGSGGENLTWGGRASGPSTDEGSVRARTRATSRRVTSSAVMPACSDAGVCRAPAVMVQCEASTVPVTGSLNTITTPARGAAAAA